MEYEVGSIGDLISGTRSPAKPRTKVSLVPLATPSPKKTSEEPAQIIDKTKTNSTKKKNKNKVQDDSVSDRSFMFLSQLSDNNDMSEENEKTSKKNAKKIKKGDDPMRVVKEFYIGKDDQQSDKKRKHQDGSDDNKVKKKKKSKVAESDDATVETNDENATPKKGKKDEKKKKRVIEEESIEQTIENREVDDEDSDRGDNHESDKDDDDDDEDDVKELTNFQKAAERRVNQKIQREQKFDDDDISRTLFVGNVPISIVKQGYEKILRQKFKPYGKVESVRIRNIPVPDLKTKPKTALIEKTFHPERNSAIAFVKFANPNSVEKALVENNSLLEGNHLRVDRCYRGKPQVDGKKSIFIGNLPFDVDDETVRNAFQNCGEIVSVRVIRDNKTKVGKGIAFVNFANSDGVEMALAMAKDTITVGKKEVRVKRYISNPKKGQLGKFEKGPRSKFGKHSNDSSGEAPRTWSSKKRDEQGNKVRKYDKLRERPGRQFKLNQIKNNEGNDDNDTTVNEDETTKKTKLNKHQEFKGLMAVKKKKMKKSKATLEKKKISKILLQPPKDA